MKILFCAALLCIITAHAQQASQVSGLAVTVLPVKVAGQRALVKLVMTNHFTNAVESARAVCFLLDEHGKMIGHASKWVVGENKHELEPKGETTFNFVITSSQPFTTTNLTAKVSFSRVVLGDDRLADITKEVMVTPVEK
jgi:hypothetical protein